LELKAELEKNLLDDKKGEGGLPFQFVMPGQLRPYALPTEVKNIDLPYDTHFKMYHSHPNKQWFWNNLSPTPKWEPATFEFFHHFIDLNTTYLGFGEWNGITLLYAASRAKKCYGIEPDPYAFSIMSSNAALNPNLPIQPSNLCISEKLGSTMFTNRGDSGGHIQDSQYLLNEPGNLEYVAVKTVPLGMFIESAKIGGHVFMKIDCEGCERFLFKQWLALFATMNPKPVIHISMHGKLFDYTDEEKRDHDEFLNSFDYVWTESLETTPVPKRVPLPKHSTVVNNESYLCVPKEIYNYVKTQKALTNNAAWKYFEV